MKAVNTVAQDLNFSGSINGDAIDVKDAFSLGIVSNITIQTPTAKTFDSSAKASLTIQDLKYSAKTAGVAGNATTIEYLQRIAAVKASKIIQDITITAKTAGAAGNGISVQYIEDGVAGSETVDVTVNAIVVHIGDHTVLASTATQVKASIDASTPAAALVDTAITGTGSNGQLAVGVTSLTGGANAIGLAGSEVVAVTGTAITVRMESGVSTATQVKAAVDASGAAAVLVDVTIPGTGSNAQTAPVAQGPLVGGVDSEENLSLDQVFIPTHGYKTGLKGQLTTTGTLPGGLSTSTDYYLIVVPGDLIKFASSLANAAAGTAIDLTSEGNGVHTFTPSALAGATVKLQWSLDGLIWVDVASATTISASMVFSALIKTPEYNFLRFVFVSTGGQILAENRITVKV